jgi:hypothetical protein
VAVFQAGTKVETADPVVEVTVSVDRPIPVGSHRFQLVVQDESGNLSDPAVVTVIIKDTKKPTAVLDEVGVVEFGQSFTLSGKRSSHIPPGKIVKYVWTMMD